MPVAFDDSYDSSSEESTLNKCEPTSSLAPFNELTSTLEKTGFQPKYFLAFIYNIQQTLFPSKCKF